MGRAYANLKQYPEAIAAYKKTIAIHHPNGANAHEVRRLIRELSEK
jgi:hypothetical protein